MVKSQGCIVATVAATVTATSLLLNQQLSSFSAPLLLRDIILMFVIRETVLASARTESSLSAGQSRFADSTNSLHTTSKVGLQAYHTQF
jgi:hypothetical protein